MTGRNVSLTDQSARFVEGQVKTGRHQSASEVVREALRRYESGLAAEQALYPDDPRDRPRRS